MARTGDPKRLLRLHVSLVVAAVICSGAFAVELWRALGGNELSWAYVFEWPLFLAYGIYMWRRLVREERGEVVARPLPAARPEEEAELERWNRYLADLHAAEGARPPLDTPRAP